jgi:Fe-S-cluster containining protein
MPAPRTKTEKALDALYSELPKIACQGRCQNSCANIVNAMSHDERLRIEKRTGKPMSGHQLGPKPEPCELLTHSGHCSVYTARPMICRLWGLVESMPCPHGCKPDFYLTHEEGHAFLRRARAVGAGDAAPR